MYHEINEDLAKQAKAMWSFTDYVDGSATAEYKALVDKAYELVEECPEHVKEKAKYYAELFARKLAENINKQHSIDIQCPSVMISGASNFPVRKKEKQVASLGKNFKDREYIMEYLTKIENLTKATYTEPEKENTTTVYEEFTIVENYEADRIQLIFDGKPDEETRAIIKSKAFKWSPRFGAWQRQLTDNGRAAAQLVLRKIKEGESK